MKDTREASLEFDSAIALTSETVTRGVSVPPTKTSPQGCTSFHKSISQKLDIQPCAVYATKPG